MAEKRGNRKWDSCVIGTVEKVGGMIVRGNGMAGESIW